MNSIVKDGNDTYAVLNADGKVIAYLKKNCFGTHGHWKGWKHYPFCNQTKSFLWAASEIVIDHQLKRWTDEPVIFLNIKEAKKYYGILKEG